MTGIPRTSQYYTALDLKDTFFCTPLDLQSQELFASEWQDLDLLVRMQYCWTVLPQGFKNFPTLLGEALAQDLQALQLEKGVLLQYVADLLITGDSEQHDRGFKPPGRMRV